MICYWNKRKVDRTFKEEYMPEIREQEQGRKDVCLRTLTYNNYIDHLQKDSLINEMQRINYTIPKDLIKDWSRK